MDIETFAKWFFTVLGLLVLTAGLSGAIYSIARSAGADGQNMYCYIEYDNNSVIHLPAYRLTAFRNWRADRILGVYPTADAAAEAASKLQCPLRSK